MSITKSEMLTKRVLPLIQPEWDDFLHDIATETAVRKSPLHLSLPPVLIATLLHTLPAHTHCKVALRIPKELQPEAPESWHVIADTLTEQEIDGTIATSLALAYHALLSSSASMPIAYTPAMEEIMIPSISVYQERCTTLATGQRMALSDLSALLVRAGYIRHTKAVADNGFSIQGDTLRVVHPLFRHPIRIEFFGTGIERILEEQDRRSIILQTITIPPLAFPEESVTLKEVLTNIPTIIPNSASADIVVPERLLHIELPSYTPIKSASSPKKYASPIAAQRALELIGKLTPGKPAVHADHGIGIFEGLEKRKVGNEEAEYLVLRYADGDSIAVPVPFAHKVSPYIGETSPAIYKLGGTAWSTTKKKAQADAAAFAKELLEITKQREHARRPSYTINSDLDAAMQSSFGFELTPDQATAWEEVKQDMLLSHPMDRLIVGDVGFGKTELAIRAAMHAYANGKQVALLAPTTLLVQQHVDTFRSRLPNIADSIFLISRFSSKEEIKKAKEVLQSGKSAIIIGTHALLSANIPWTNLGFLIIDEEQRFGVRQKEHLKKMRSHIDILSLSATPIPRTLSMALSGMRSLSIIATAPQGRKDIHTVVKKQSDETVREALTQELERGGQVYVVSSKIRNLSMIEEIIHALIPSAKTAIAHAKLPDEELSKIIHEFDTKEIDILVSSSIVENGLDLPNVNTMIVWNAPHFGLGQLYQLRGRIGRRSRQGHAYFLYGQEKLTPIQRMRLTALTEASRVGSGWDIARRDLEMRGAGNMLGAKQSGSAHEVGMQLYLDMVDGTAEDPKADIRILLPSFIPTSYIENSDDRTSWYIRLSRAATTKDLETKAASMQEAYGPMPEEATNLVRMISLELLATEEGILKISTRTISPSDEDPYVRIECETKHPLQTLKKLSTITNADNSPARWQARNATLSWDTDAITPTIVDKLISSLRL